MFVGDDDDDDRDEDRGSACGDSSTSLAAHAASMLGYDTIIRRNERSGENEFSGVGDDRRSRIFSSEEPWKVAGLLRFVIRSVLEGGEGQTRGGRDVRSREREEGEEEEGFAAGDWGEPVGEAGGDMVEGSIIVFFCFFFWW